MARKDQNRGFSRPVNTREERKSVECREYLTFSLKDLDETQPRNEPQTLLIWENENLLKSLIVRLKELSKLTRAEAVKQQLIKIYGEFPPKTNFVHPPHVEQNAVWGIIKGVGGQKLGVAGYIVENTFYIVFLDKDHKFWIAEKKNT